MHTRHLPVLLAVTVAVSFAQSDGDVIDLRASRERGKLLSSYLASRDATGDAAIPSSDLASFESEIAPILNRACLDCHGPDEQKGGVRIDELDPDLLNGEDVDWWLDVQAVLTNGEMPPEGKAELSAEDRGTVIEWLAKEVQFASTARRASSGHSGFRRMTRYEYEYALQDLLGEPFSFADDLLPDPVSEDGFQNSAEMLHLSPTQLRAYLESNRKALRAVTVTGDQPTTWYWSITMDAAAAVAFRKQSDQIKNARNKHANDSTKLEAELSKLRERFSKRPGGPHFESLVTGRVAGHPWAYNGAQYAWAPSDRAPSADVFERDLDSEHVGILPRGQGMILELGERVPDEGLLRVRVLASRVDSGEDNPPSLRLAFGWRASNDSRAVVDVSERDHLVTATHDAPAVYEYRIPMREVWPRNGVRHTAKLGALPSPSEYIKLVNASRSAGSIRIHHVEIAAPFYEAWPPASHTRLFPARTQGLAEAEYAHDVLSGFMERAWRRHPTADELDRKQRLYDEYRAEGLPLEDAMIETLATVLSSPHFLFVGVDAQGDGRATLATRLSMFLWCSLPDDELLGLANDGALHEPEVLAAQARRLLADPRARRFSERFVRQWLDMALLDHLHVDRKAYPNFNGGLKASMAAEPVAFFHELLATDASVLDFVHADFAMVDERLAGHYGIEGVTGNDVRRIALAEGTDRGGLLTQAGLLAMNSDGKDSHPLKRGVWLLERLLDDPPPPPPPAVPEIDLTDPEIAKMTLKERIEDHRNHPACMSCHAKIDPWGIAFEHYGATGRWRDDVQGRPVDASSTLFNGQELDGMQGLKAFLLEHRQDQVVRALTHKLATFALGRPLTFEDRAAVDGIAADVRRKGDGLATMVTMIVTSDLFRTE